MADFTYRDLTIDTYFDKIFYINLDEDIERNDNILNEFNKHGITNIERVSASKFKILPREHLYRNFNKKDEKYLLGSISCRDSHLKCVKLAKQRKYKKILILEDDIIFMENPNIIIKQNHEILNDWDMLYFGGLVEPFFRNQIVCAHSYAVKDTIYDDIIFMAENSGMEIDNFYAKMLQHMSYNYNQSGKYNIRIAMPFNTIVQNKNFRSNIGQEIVPSIIPMRGQPHLIDGLNKLIEEINKNGHDTSDMTMIEIGSYAGESTMAFAKHFKKVIAIDSWQDGYDDNDIASHSMPLADVEKIFDQQVKNHANIIKIKSKSDDAIKLIQEDINFVYIDGMHTFEQVKKDIINYAPLLGKDCFIGGHDFSDAWSGVKKAVIETLGNSEWTFEDSSWLFKAKEEWKAIS